MCLLILSGMPRFSSDLSQSYRHTSASVIDVSLPLNGPRLPYRSVRLARIFIPGPGFHKSLDVALQFVCSYGFRA
jgi:hypothetical protein